MSTGKDVSTSQGIVEVKRKNDQGYWSFKVGETWYGAGKYEPKFDKGDEIKFGHTQNGKYFNLEFGTVEVVEKGKGTTENIPQGSSGATDWDKKDRRITYLACRNSSLALVSAAVASDSVSLPTKKADRFDVLKELVQDTTEEYFEDIYGAPFKEDG